MSDDELDGLELTQWVELAETQLVDAEAADDAEAIKSTLPLLHNCIERSTALYGAGSSRTCDHRVRLAGGADVDKARTTGDAEPVTSISVAPNQSESICIKFHLH